MKAVNPTGGTPYRDGLTAAQETYAAERAQARRRAAVLTSFSRQRLPRGLRTELSALERQLDDAPRTLDDVHDATEVLGQYEEALAVALDLHAEQARQDRQRSRRLLRGAAIALALGVVGGALAYGPASRYYEKRAACATACRERGLCAPRATRLSDDDALSYELGSNCIATGSADCRASLACAREGRCTALAGDCIAGRAASCRASLACADEGRCVVAAGQCVPWDDAMCRRAPVCAREGRCAAGMVRCVASAAGCAAATVCRLEQRCHVDATSGACVRAP